ALPEKIQGAVSRHRTPIRMSCRPLEDRSHEIHEAGQNDSIDGVKMSQEDRTLVGLQHGGARRGILERMSEVDDPPFDRAELLNKAFLVFFETRHDCRIVFEDKHVAHAGCKGVFEHLEVAAKTAVVPRIGKACSLANFACRVEFNLAVLRLES